MLNRQRELTLSQPTVAPTATRSTYFNTAFFCGTGRSRIRTPLRTPDRAGLDSVRDKMGSSETPVSSPGASPLRVSCLCELPLF